MMYMFGLNSTIIFGFPFFFILYLLQGIFPLLSLANYNFLLLVQPCLFTLGCFNNGKADY